MNETSLPYESLPLHLREGIRLWIEEAVTPGSFLRSVLRNDLFEAVTRADDVSLTHLKSIMLWLHNEAPRGSFGAARVFTDWPMFVKASKRQQEASFNAPQAR